MLVLFYSQQYPVHEVSSPRVIPVVLLCYLVAVSNIQLVSSTFVILFSVVYVDEVHNSTR